MRIFLSYAAPDHRWARWIAWQFEDAGHRVVLHARDFVPGIKFTDFVERGIADADIVVALLTRTYLASPATRGEWQAALRHAATEGSAVLVPVCVEDCSIDVPLPPNGVIDLTGMADPQRARDLLLSRLGRAASRAASRVPQHAAVPGPSSGTAHGGRGDDHSAPDRQTPRTAPDFPPASPSGPPTALSVLHVAGPRIGRAGDDGGTGLQRRISDTVERVSTLGAPRPDLVVLTGDLTDSGARVEFERALDFLVGLRALLALDASRLVVVPGPHDVNVPACRAYFELCRADGVEPQPPYAPKWRHFVRLFAEIYRGTDRVIFDSDQPWSLFPFDELNVVVAGLNSTIAQTDRDDDRYGEIGPTQAAWFGRELAPYESQNWLRLGVMAHPPVPPAKGDEALGLRDVDTFGSMVGRRLNLLLCGRYGADPRPLPARSGPAVVEMPAAEQFQLLEVDSTGVRCHRPDPAAGALVTARLHSRAWPAVRQAVPIAGGAAHGTDRTAAQSALEIAGLSSAERARRELTELIEEVCRVKYDQRAPRLIDGPVPYLRVTYADGDNERVLRIAPFVGTPTAADVEALVRQTYTTGPETTSELVFEGRPPSWALRDEARRRGVRLLSFLEFQGSVGALRDLRDYVTTQTMALRNNEVYPPDLYVPQRFRFLVGPDQIVHEDLVDELMHQLSGEDGKFIFILGEFGRGKTFALRELTRRIPGAESRQLQSLIPIFIQLRTLEKAQSVDALVAAHLANHGQDKIDLAAFRYLLRQGRIVLLFDGFDELVARVSYDRAADHLDTLVAAAQGSAKIIVTSRRQHFRTDSQVLTALGQRVGVLPSRQVVQLEDFTPAQIRQFLVNRYGDEAEANRRMSQLRRLEDLLELARNPRMLDFIAGLDPTRLQAVMYADRPASPALLYQEIVQAWLRMEVRRAQGTAGAPPGPSEQNLWRAVSAVAMRLWDSGESHLRLEEILEVAGGIAQFSEVQLSREQAGHAIGSGSLLVRSDDGRFGFIHRSIMEWLVARELAAQLDRGEAEPDSLTRGQLSQLTVDFMVDLADPRRTEEWARRVLSSPHAGEIAQRNALRVSKRLSMPVGKDMRGASLKGEDLSYRDLSGVDLTGADLSDTSLVRTNLSGATLCGARLTGARLEQTHLNEADLSGADLSRASLLQADLRGATVTGSRWRRTALIDVNADPATLARPEFGQAALAPGQPVVSAILPATVGVSFGFETGQIAEPMAYSPDGDILAAGSDDGAVLLCDSATGLPIRTLHGHTGRTYVVCFGPPDTVLVTGSDDDTVRLWDPSTGEALGELTGQQEWVWPVVLDAPGDRLLVGDSSGTVRIWDVRTRGLLAELPGHGRKVWTGAFSPVGDLVATGDSDGVVRLFDPSTGELRRVLRGDLTSTYRLAFDPHRPGSLVTAGHEGVLRVWNTADGRLEQEFPGHGGAIYTIDFHPRRRVLASGDTTGRVHLRNLADGTSTSTASAHQHPLYSVRFSPDGELLATADRVGRVYLWKSSTGQLEADLRGHQGSVWPVAFRADGRQLATSANDGMIRLWHTATGHCRHALRGHHHKISSVQFNPDGTELAASGSDGRVRVWSPWTGRQLQTLAAEADQLHFAVYSPSDPALATACTDGRVHLWNSETALDERRLNVETPNIWALSYSVDGESIATSNDDDLVKLWSSGTGRLELVLRGHRGRVRSIAFSATGEIIATGCDDSRVRLWSRASGECEYELEKHTDRVWAVSFSPDGSLLASAGNDGHAYLWDLATRTVRFHLRAGWGGKLWTAAFSQDGGLLATGGDDLVVRLWDCATGELRHELMGHTRRVTSISFSPDGRLAASGSDDGTVRVWDLTPEDGPVLRIQLAAFGDVWAALCPDGRYKTSGDVAGRVWHAIGTRRFELGELTPYLPQVRPIALGAVF